MYCHGCITHSHKPQQIARTAENVVLQIELSFHFEIIWYSFMHVSAHMTVDMAIEYYIIAHALTAPIYI